MLAPASLPMLWELRVTSPPPLTVPALEIELAVKLAPLDAEPIWPPAWLSRAPAVMDKVPPDSTRPELETSRPAKLMVRALAPVTAPVSSTPPAMMLPAA